MYFLKIFLAWFSREFVYEKKVLEGNGKLLTKRDLIAAGGKRIGEKRNNSISRKNVQT